MPLVSCWVLLSASGKVAAACGVQYAAQNLLESLSGSLPYVLPGQFVGQHVLHSMHCTEERVEALLRKCTIPAAANTCCCACSITYPALGRNGVRFMDTLKIVTKGENLERKPGLNLQTPGVSRSKNIVCIDQL
jgi:hypothetical protein